MKEPTHPGPTTRVEFLSDLCDDGALKADGFDGALVGVVNIFTGTGRRAVLCYDVNRMIDILVKRDGMSHEDAAEFLDFNVLDAYVGEGTPAFLATFPLVLRGG